MVFLVSDEARSLTSVVLPVGAARTAGQPPRRGSMHGSQCSQYHGEDVGKLYCTTNVRTPGVKFGMGIHLYTDRTRKCYIAGSIHLILDSATSLHRTDVDCLHTSSAC